MPGETAEFEKTQEWSPVRWALKAWVWIVLLSAALIAELVAGPLLAALILALKFGGSDLALGIWLRHRGAPALGYFAWAQAFLKVAAAGFALGIIITALEPLFGVPFNPEKLIGALVMLFAGTFCSGVTMFAGAVSVPYDASRLWLDKSAYGDLLANRWPLSCSGKRNRVPLQLILGMVATTCFALLMTTGLGLIGLAVREPGPIIGATVVFMIWVSSLWKGAAALRQVHARERANADLKSRPDDAQGQRRDAPAARSAALG
ncbi:MAG TPA: hypothetical protein VMP01_13450 [Pirellulaceae bacterium]|nr:hypothetical protein [Pirellulaceae bacterium]